MKPFLRRPTTVLMLCVIGAYVVVAILVACDVLAGDWNRRVAGSFIAPSWETPFGTDRIGRSVLAKVLYGFKNSLGVTIIATVVSAAIGTVLGTVAGYFGGLVDAVVVWFYSTISSIPGFLLTLALAFVLHERTVLGFPADETVGLALILGITRWVGLCRLLRGEVIKHRDREYALAASSLGATPARVLRRHILPNVTHLIIIHAALASIGFLHAGVMLSFFGVGVANEPSWGGMIDEARLDLSWGAWWQMAAASTAIFGLSLALHVVADAARDALDPRLRGSK